MPSIIPDHSSAPSAPRNSTRRPQSPPDTRSGSSSPVFKLRNGVYVPVKKARKPGVKRIKHALPESDSESDTEHHSRRLKNTRNRPRRPAYQVPHASKSVHLIFASKTPDARLPTVKTPEGEEPVNSARLYMKSENLGEM
ncbi:hypothetical protein BDZ89DRAFT_1138675 [Hymenopellis radicata]|nr:hypothetical protein BDZ89DRAFT_1138675 [Hymenopellis radicata]